MGPCTGWSTYVNFEERTMRKREEEDKGTGGGRAWSLDITLRAKENKGA